MGAQDLLMGNMDLPVQDISLLKTHFLPVEIRCMCNVNMVHPPVRSWVLHV